MIPSFEIIDISQPVTSRLACFPGDVPFHRDVTLSYQDSSVINLCAFTMSPHVGTHADAPIHIHGELPESGLPLSPEGLATVGQLALDPFIGPAVIVDLSPYHGAIQWSQVQAQLEAYSVFPERILFKTTHSIRYEIFEERYAWLSVDLIEQLGQRGVKLVGVDTPSVDAIDSKTLETHHALLKANIFWLENLDLTQVALSSAQLETFFLSAAPLKLMELEAAPVRAVLLRF